MEDKKDHWYWQLPEKACEQLGIKVYDVEYLPSAKILRVYICNPIDFSATIQDCVAVDRLLGDLMELDERVPNQLTLEVSSPGLERQLKEPWHYESALGKEVRITLLKKNSAITTMTPKDQTSMELDQKSTLDVMIQGVNQLGLEVISLEPRSKKMAAPESSSSTLKIDFRRIKKAQVQLRDF